MALHFMTCTAEILLQGRWGSDSKFATSEKRGENVIQSSQIQTLPFEVDLY